MGFSITEPLNKEFFFRQFDHVRLYVQDYEIKFIDVGFKVAKISPEKFILDTIKYRVNPKEYIYICLK